MNLGIKLLIGGISLATASYGGYFVYKQAHGTSSEKEKTPSNGSPKPTDTNGNQKQPKDTQLSSSPSSSPSSEN